MLPTVNSSGHYNFKTCQGEEHSGMQSNQARPLRVASRARSEAAAAIKEPLQIAVVFGDFFGLAACLTAFCPDESSPAVGDLRLLPPDRWVAVASTSEVSTGPSSIRSQATEHCGIEPQAGHRQRPCETRFSVQLRFSIDPIAQQVQAQRVWFATSNSSHCLRRIFQSELPHRPAFDR